MTYKRSRHILTLGQIKQEYLQLAVKLWKAEKINQKLMETDTVLLLIDFDTTTTLNYIKKIREIDKKSCTVGVIPISSGQQNHEVITHLLQEDILRIDLNKSRFRLTTNPIGNFSNAPPVLQRANYDEPSAVAEDLAIADLLFLQGHAGPIDGAFGKWLNLCSRHLAQENDSPLFSCFGTNRCFRQMNYDRASTSADGLVNAKRFQSALVVLDGCGIFPLPGGMFDYKRSIACAIISSQVRATVMAQGLVSTSLSVVIMFVALLAKGNTLSEAVKAANQYQKELRGAVSIDGSATAPWILLGNPEIRVEGLKLYQPQIQSNNGNLEFILDNNLISTASGMLLTIPEHFCENVPFDVFCSDEERWIYGVVQQNKSAYIWIASQNKSTFDNTNETKIILSKRQKINTDDWIRRSKSLQVNQPWFENLIALVAKNGGDVEGLRTVISKWNHLKELIDFFATAIHMLHKQIITPSFEKLTLPLNDMIHKLDEFTVKNIALVIPKVGSKMTRFWSGHWGDIGSVLIGKSCTCGCPISGNIRYHPITELTRINLNCPACGMLGNVSAVQSTKNILLQKIMPIVTGVPTQRELKPGQKLCCPIQFSKNYGYACGVLFEPFRQKYIITEIIPVLKLAENIIEITIPQDWPLGLSQVAIPIVSDIEMSFIDFDIIIKR